MSDIKLSWSSYEGYEGWMHRGTARILVKPSDPPLRKLLGVVTSTEGGCADAYNGYDRAIWSIGHIQLAGSIGLAGALIASIRNQSPLAYEPLKAWMGEHSLDFGPGGQLLSQGKPVPSGSMARVLYGCSAQIGSYTPENKEQAASFARAVIECLRGPEAPEIAEQHVMARLLTFASAFAVQLLGLRRESLATSGWLGAAQAAFLSFSANNTEIADAQLREVVKRVGSFDPNKKEHVHEMLRQLTYGPFIAIYPERYNAIRPKLESFYGVDLPDTGAQLDAWVRAGNPTGVYIGSKEIQQMLIQLGYDLGPAGADGVMGSKTKEAVRQFQRTQQGLVADGMPGSKTVKALVQAIEAKGTA